MRHDDLGRRRERRTVDDGTSVSRERQRLGSRSGGRSSREEPIRRGGQMSGGEEVMVSRSGRYGVGRREKRRNVRFHIWK